DGRLLETHWTLPEADRSAVETALRLREAASAPVTIEVAAVGPRGAAQVLREVLSHGVDRARLVVSEAEALTPDSAARALAAVLGASEAFDLVLGGGGTADGDEGLLAPLTAEALGIPHAGQAAHLLVRATAAEMEVSLDSADGRRQRLRLLPA